ncbi:hypothetical protein [Natrinema salaciae]|uniref:hypothetical protein n=1 Tax=Natrinema salaciae TaxID=1186196 RepID=UPI001FE0FB21|nr:hypothetical protein [Natrinema salaciae]
MDDDFPVLRVLGGSRGLIDWRAHEYAVAELELTADDETFDPGHVLDEKRRAKATYETVLGPDPAPFTTVLSEPAIGNIRVADVDRNSWAGSSWKPWNERVQAYLNDLLGRARLRESPDVYDRIVDDG